MLLLWKYLSETHFPAVVLNTRVDVVCKVLLQAHESLSVPWWDLRRRRTCLGPTWSITFTVTSGLWLSLRGLTVLARPNTSQSSRSVARWRTPAWVPSNKHPLTRQIKSTNLDFLCGGAASVSRAPFMALKDASQAAVVFVSFISLLIGSMINKSELKWKHVVAKKWIKSLFCFNEKDKWKMKYKINIGAFSRR